MTFRGIPASKRMEPGHLLEILQTVEQKLEALGYRPDALMQVAGTLLVSHGMKVLDSYVGRRAELSPVLFDIYRDLVGNVNQYLIAYKYEQKPEGPEPEKNMSDEMLERAIAELGRRRV